MSSDQTLPTGHSPQIVVQSAPTLPAGAMAVFSPDLKGTQIQSNVSMTLSREDMAAIATAEAEKQIRQKVAALSAELKKMETTYNNLSQEQTDFLSTWTKELGSLDIFDQIGALADAIEGFTGREPTISYSPASYSELQGELVGTVSVSGQAQGSSFQLARVVKANPPQPFKDRVLELRTLGRAIEVKKREVIGARSALNNVDAIQRQALAGMAAAVVSKTEGGQDIVDAIRASVNADDLIGQLQA